MTETDQAPKAARPWQWPGEWVKDQSFWRDIATRTASGLIVLFIGYWTALLLGFIKSPDNFRNAFQVTAVVLLAIGAIACNTKIPTSSLRNKLQARFAGLTGQAGRIVAYVVALAIQAAILITLFMIGLFVLRLIFIAAAALLGIEAKF